MWRWRESNPRPNKLFSIFQRKCAESKGFEPLHLLRSTCLANKPLYHLSNFPFAGLSLLPVFLWNHLMPFNSVSVLGLPIMVKKVKAVIVQTYSIASNLPTRKLLNTENLTMYFLPFCCQWVTRTPNGTTALPRTARNPFTVIWTLWVTNPSHCQKAIVIALRRIPFRQLTDTKLLHVCMFC